MCQKSQDLSIPNVFQPKNSEEIWDTVRTARWVSSQLYFGAHIFPNISSITYDLYIPSCFPVVKNVAKCDAHYTLILLLAFRGPIQRRVFVLSLTVIEGA